MTDKIEIRITSMVNLAPMFVEWQIKVGDQITQNSAPVLVDFFHENVYWSDGKEIELCPLREELLKIIKQKKESVVPNLPETLINEAMNRHKSLLEKTNNVRSS